MRILGIGLTGCNKFCGLMDLASSFLHHSSYSDYIKNICSKVKTTAERLLFFAAQEEKSETLKNNNSNTLIVSGDGTWQKQGFSSLFGVTSLIGYFTGKVVDIFISSLLCMLCKVWDKKLTSAEFEAWHEAHIEKDECEANHTGAHQELWR